ncbi:hypothetical protein AA313_de0206917 [Arthrobotrys entomopaga]|nr:hypothetical protein AA313_de0206917 [Arthrobotrys entomopaga]
MLHTIRHLAVVFILLRLSIFTSASPAPRKYPELKLFSRQASDAICGSGSARCTNPGVSNFCCPTGTDCIAVLNNTAVGCCPTGQDCRVIASSTCSSAEAAVGSSQVTKCSNGKCCSPGYLCDGNYCQLQFQSWPQTSSSPLPTSTPTPGTSSGGNSTTLSQAQRDAGFISKSQCPTVTIGGFASGFFPGLVIGAAVVYLIMRSQLKKKEEMARQWARTPSHRSRKGSRKDAEKAGLKEPSKHDLTIGYNPEVVVTAPPETYNGLGVSLGERHYRVSTTSTRMFGDEPDELIRRGRLRVHGETPPLPSLALGEVDSGQSSESLPQSDLTKKSSSRKHKRKNSNPSFKDLASTSRFKFRNLLSHENLKEQRGSLASETSVGSSIHSSVFTGSERQSRGNRYPIAIQTGANSRSKGSAQITPTALRNEVTLHRADTNATEQTNIEDDYTPITPSNPKAFTDTDVPQPPPAPASHLPPSIEIPPHEREFVQRPQLTSPELREQYLNIPTGLGHGGGERTSVAMTEMTEVDGYKSPFHDRFRYDSYEGSSDGYEDDTDTRSLAANSTYPSSFLDIHFDANSPISPISPSENGDAKSQYGGRSLREVPSIPTIPPLFQHKNKPIQELGRSNSNSKGSRMDMLRAPSPIDRESCDITVVIDNGQGVSPKWRAEANNNNNANITSPKGHMGIGGAMNGGRYTKQTMEMNKF